MAVPVHVQANYIPETGEFRFIVRDERDGREVTLNLPPATFAEIVEYLDLVLADYSEAKAMGQIPKPKKGGGDASDPTGPVDP